MLECWADLQIICWSYRLGGKLNSIVCAGLSSAEQPFPCSNQQAARQNSSLPACLLCPSWLMQRACSPKAAWCGSHHTSALLASSHLLRLPHGLMPTLRKPVSPAHMAVSPKMSMIHTRQHRFDGRLGISIGASWSVADYCCVGRALLLLVLCSSHLQKRFHFVTTECPFMLGFTHQAEVGLALFFFLLYFLVTGRLWYLRVWKRGGAWEDWRFALLKKSIVSQVYKTFHM